VRLIFSYLYWQYYSPLTHTAFDLGPSSIPTCSGMAVQCSSVEYLSDMSGRVYEPYRGNESSGMPFFCVKLGDIAITTHGKLEQAFGDDAVSRTQDFRWHKMFSESRTHFEDGQLSG